MEGIERRPLFAFVEHGYAQHGGGEWHVSYCVRYHTCVVPESQYLPDVTGFAYGGSAHAGFTADALSLKKVGGSGVDDFGVEGLKIESFKEKDKKDLGLSEFSLGTGSITEEKLEQSKKKLSCCSGSQ